MMGCRSLAGIGLVSSVPAGLFRREHRCVVRQPSFYDTEQLRGYDRFSEEVVHAGGETSESVLGEDTGRECNDPYVVGGSLATSYLECCLNAIHLRHVQVEKNQIEGAFFPCFDCFDAVAHCGDVMSA